MHFLCQEREADLTEAFAHLDAMRIAISRGDISAYLAPSLEIHNALARAANRPLLASVEEQLLSQMQPHLWLLIENYDLPIASEPLALHERLCNGLDPGNGCDAATAISLVPLFFKVVCHTTAE